MRKLRSSFRKRNMRLYALIGLFNLMLLLYLFFWPVPITAVKWIPKKAPELTGVYQQNRALEHIARIGETYLVGAEDIAFDSIGRSYFGLQDGSIFRLSNQDARPEQLIKLKGPIWGMESDIKDNLIVAAPSIGLVQITQQLDKKVLSNKDGGLRFRLVNDVDIAKDGTIYFTDSSFKHGPKHIYDEIMEAGPNGRLLRYDTDSGKTTLLLDRLCFANGVAVGPDDAYILVNEMTRYRIRRYWLRGPKKGTDEIFKENLPGMPDGISFNKKDTFWLALYTPRAAALDHFLYPHPVFREMLFRIPNQLRPKGKRYGFVLGLKTNGAVTHNYQDPTGAFSPVSSVVEHNRNLYLGSTVQRGVGIFPL